MDVTISYHTVDGEISSVATEPYTRSIAMLTDALGSVVRTEYPFGGADFRYSAYGKLLKQPVGWNTPYIGWVGSYGYRVTNLNHAEQYIRARHYSTTEARWTTVDPLWPNGSSYEYMAGGPTNLVDALGAAGAGRNVRRLSGSPNGGFSGNCGIVYGITYEALIKCFSVPEAKLIATIMTCISDDEAGGCDPNIPPDQGNIGVYSLDHCHYDVCKPKCCTKRDITQVHCNVYAAVNMVVYFFQCPFSDYKQSLGTEMCAYWGTFWGCPIRPRHHHQGDGTFKSCIEANHYTLDQLYKLPIPKPAPGCQTCIREPGCK